ncbi:hypothetical protein BDZ89DRAFT_1054273 [Hymenopellis radicata]|nr:hypothetical protein BDZ89DRAFT_1054273 [Hymenopellis radicata]
MSPSPSGDGGGQYDARRRPHIGMIEIADTGRRTRVIRIPSMFVLLRPDDIVKPPISDIIVGENITEKMSRHYAGKDRSGFAGKMVLKTVESGVLELHRQTQSNTDEHERTNLEETSRTSHLVPFLTAIESQRIQANAAHSPSSAPIPSASAHSPSSAPIPSASAHSPSSAPIPSASAHGSSSAPVLSAPGPSSAPVLSAPGPSSAPVLTGGALQRMRNSNNGFACEKCGKVFNSLKDLNAHRKRKKHGKALRQKGDVIRP